jgi:Ni/Co efflux regulator RcnB
MTAKSFIQITVAALAIAAPLAASSTASARVIVRDHRHIVRDHRKLVRHHGHDDRNIVRGHHHLYCHRYGGPCTYDGKVVPRPIVRDHRNN